MVRLRSPPSGSVVAAMVVTVAGRSHPVGVRGGADRFGVQGDGGCGVPTSTVVVATLDLPAESSTVSLAVKTPLAV
jgi:hypothetical protein